MLRRFLLVALAALGGGVLLAPAAGADPAKPGNYRSDVVAIEPATDAISAKVVGGDGFLELQVAPGHEAEVPGYTGEPWLRVDADGTVQRNEASSATYLNESRYGTADNTDVPEWITAKNATENPQWTTVATDGGYIWHDHRIHYMTPQIEPTIIEGTNLVVMSQRDDGRWSVPLTVDGAETEILGELRRYPAPSPLPQWGVAALVALALAATGLMLRGPASRIAAGSLVVAGGLAIWIGVSEMMAVPPLAGGNPLWVALPAVAVVAALGAAMVRSAAGRAIGVLASAAALGVWAVLRIPAFDKAVPLGTVDPTVTRLVIAAALGTAAGAIIAAIASGGLALQLADLDDDDDDLDDDAAGEPRPTSAAPDTGGGTPPGTDPSPAAG